MAEHFGGFYKGKRVLVTGDSGFKGSWLAIWLKELGASVVGYSLAPPDSPSNFAACRLAGRITHIDGDIRDCERLSQAFRDYQPEIVFHLAAQPLVRLSFDQPRYTFETNVMGTVNVLESARNAGSVRSVVAISSDKCYQSDDTDRPHPETDPLGGHDPYSASKACAELAIAVYGGSRFQESAMPQRRIPIASARAGNVIGGGDWALDRIVPDTIRAITLKSPIVVRNPESTRPWQHVLEPLSAYLWLGVLQTRDARYSSAWNIGPEPDSVPPVEQIVRGLLRRWPGSPGLTIEPDRSMRETKFLRLDSSKANRELGWRPVWDIERTLDSVVAWYRHYYESGSQDMYSFTAGQIEEYGDSAVEKGVAWASG